MSPIDIPHESAQAWFAAAMMRISTLDETQIRQRQAIADAHNACNGIKSPETLIDQQLYIQGRMELDEYERYLLFKYGKA